MPTAVHCFQGVSNYEKAPINRGRAKKNTMLPDGTQVTTSLHVEMYGFLKKVEWGREVS